LRNLWESTDQASKSKCTDNSYAKQYPHLMVPTLSRIWVKAVGHSDNAGFLACFHLYQGNF